MSYIPYIILGCFAIMILFIMGFLGLVAIKKIAGKRKKPDTIDPKTGEMVPDETNLESGDIDIIDKPGWFLYFRRRIAFYWNEFWYDRWLRVIRLREDRRMDFKNCIVSDKTVTFEDKTQYAIHAKNIVRHQGKSYYFVVEGKGDFNPFGYGPIMSDKDFYAKYNSARARELYLMTQYPVIQYLLYIGLLIIGMLVMVIITDLGVISSVESTKLDMLLDGMQAGPP